MRTAISPRLATSRRPILWFTVWPRLRQCDQHLEAERADHDREDALERAFGRAVREPRPEGRQHHAAHGEPNERRDVDEAEAVRRQTRGAPAVDQIADRADDRDGKPD